MDAKQCDYCEGCFPTPKVVELEVSSPGEFSSEGVEACSIWKIDVCKTCLGKYPAQQLLERCCNGFSGEAPDMSVG